MIKESFNVEPTARIGLWRHFRGKAGRGGDDADSLRYLRHRSFRLWLDVKPGLFTTRRVSEAARSNSSLTRRVTIQRGVLGHLFLTSYRETS